MEILQTTVKDQTYTDTPLRMYIWETQHRLNVDRSQDTVSILRSGYPEWAFKLASNSTSPYQRDKIDCGILYAESELADSCVHIYDRAKSGYYRSGRELTLIMRF